MDQKLNENVQNIKAREDMPNNLKIFIYIYFININISLWSCKN